MTLHALRLPKKVEPLPASRERDRPKFVYSETSEAAVNGQIAMLFVTPLAARGRASGVIV
ncbi:hypothetical protein HJB56_07970 [Rhizobium lentis]|uniref:hypothetical protein n=1 Tax=Rhizobium lentis TaxID=1138194 RepID=UPI001A925F2F|nr:hypothetical protein [Rhizobium lentis]MBX4997031.1 hypothetical protein [Rhizobium lentis]MBX5065020.1 hypothetical protein [Rhizobium lentis]MBX5077156.1 hypothetical protein [Rhizobium lentis]MBX5082700.1 hypothetical protein [Rhizobium lentis]MBX5096159.1 hypothetical protein [Rhizobium lentis]